MTVDELADAIAQEPDEDKQRLAITQGFWTMPKDMLVKEYMDAIVEAFARHGKEIPTPP